MYVFLVLLGLFIWQVVQTERLRSRLGHVESILDDMRHYSVETEEEAG